MISINDIKRMYIKLYKCMRQYIWTYDTVFCLAKLEESLFSRFPDLTKCRNLCNQLYNMCREVFKEDEEFKNQFIEFKQLLEENSDIFSYLTSNIPQQSKEM